jgi:peptidoglycan hydrolase-like protein with peptidoglycan-binding domain
MALALALTLLCTCDAFATTTYSTLEYGSRGSDVLTLQKALLSLGFDPGSLDGKFGRGTETAVKLYQESKKLTADGKAGNLTLTALYADADTSASSSSDTGTDTTTTTTSTTRVSTNPTPSNTATAETR